MPRHYPAELRRQTCERMLAGEAVKDLVAELGISEETLYRWRRQALIDAGERPGAKSYEADPLQAARRRVKELEAELKLVKAASALFERGRCRPKRKFQVVRGLNNLGYSERVACRVVGLSRSTYYDDQVPPADRPRDPPPAVGRRHRRHPRPLSGHLRDAARPSRAGDRTRPDRQQEAGVEDHARARHQGPARAAERHQEPQERADLRGPRPTPVPRHRPERAVAHRHHRTPHQRGQALLLRRARPLLPQDRRLGHRPALRHRAGQRRPRQSRRRHDQRTRTVIHSDHGSQFTSWAFTENVRRLGLVSSMGTVGDCYDNAPMESFWGSMQIELLNRQRWRTNLELAIAIADYIEHFYNPARRHSALGYLTPNEFEDLHSAKPQATLS